ncbi:MAG: bifunctional ADP-heptose synthase [bacterium]
MRLKALLSRIPGKRALVLGDVILDEYLFGDVRRVSPEAPIPNVEIKEETVTLGAAAYVASHVQHLGGRATLCGIVGDDAGGAKLRALLRERGIDGSGVLSDASRPTIVKTRVIARQQQMLRLDRERIHPASRELTARLLAGVERALPAADVLFLIDYDKGAFTPELIRGAIRAARRARVPVAVNPKPHLALRFRHATAVSMNLEEAATCLKRPLADEAAFLAGGAELRRRLGADAALVTRHEHGLGVFTSGPARMIPTSAREVFDGTGAGDTVIAVTGMGLAAGGRIEDSVRLASAAAGIEVGKLGCALVSREEIRAAL